MKVDLQSVFPLLTLTPVVSTRDPIVSNVPMIAQLIVSEESNWSNQRTTKIRFEARSMNMLSTTIDHKTTPTTVVDKQQ